MTHPDNLDAAVKQTVAYLYEIEGELTPQQAQAVHTLRQGHPQSISIHRARKKPWLKQTTK